MSQPKRYDIDSDGVPYPLDTGDYVRHSDYAALAAENERLRKAGDAMDAYLKRQDGTTNGQLDVRTDWQNAKDANLRILPALNLRK